MSHKINISFQNIPVFIEEWKALELLLEKAYSSCFILTDRNVSRDCLHRFIQISKLEDYHLIVIDAGEKHKNFETVQYILSELIKHEADRKSILLNLGGGMVTDIGGFCAAIYKRGIDFINIPTSLLAMVDASIGGKTGIDFHFIKNAVGSFTLPKAVFVDPIFLKTLEHREFLNGMAEVYKHALVYDADLWKSLSYLDVNKGEIPIELLTKAIKVKTTIVDLDFKEQVERKLLNFGHTIGHGLESLYLMKKEELPHGFGVAVGMWMEAWINQQNSFLSAEDLGNITQQLEKYFNLVEIDEKDYDTLISFIRNDKKSTKHQLEICQILSLGYARPSLQIKEDDLKNSFTAFNNMSITRKSL